mmetsp:Transcript_26271/g.27348  ORF Transcript_26271/g.27348 Transcript_26271/m.27348 type:complete len:156 (+) Transcript_26271:2-469(+)
MRNHDDRPIKHNPKGKYNMNFIDWNNEWERVSEVEQKIENGDPLSDEEEYQRVKEYLDKERAKNGVKLPQESLLTKKELKKLMTSDKPKECYICFQEFKENTVVIRLPCGHLYDSKCLVPWFKENSTCPTCKYDLNPKSKEQDIEEGIENNGEYY